MNLKQIDRIKLAELTSAVGAGVLGAGLGILFSDLLSRYWQGLVAIGLLLHLWGMFEKHRIEKVKSAAIPWWSAALYWICWLFLGGLIITLILRSGLADDGLPGSDL